MSAASNVVVPRQRTPLNDGDLLTTVHVAHARVTGSLPSERAAALLWAQLAVEHGAGSDTRAPLDGRAGWNIWCHNVGNRRGFWGTEGAFRMSAREVIDGHEESVSGLWPAYASPLEGAVTWIELLRREYRAGWLALPTGLPWAYAAGLKVGRYYTESVSRYAAGLATWLKIYRARWHH